MSRSQSGTTLNTKKYSYGGTSESDMQNNENHSKFHKY